MSDALGSPPHATSKITGDTTTLEDLSVLAKFANRESKGL